MGTKSPPHSSDSTLPVVLIIPIPIPSFNVNTKQGSARLLIDLEIPMDVAKASFTRDICLLSKTFLSAPLILKPS